MLSERRKKIIILALLCGAIIINALCLLFVFLHKGAFAEFLFDIGLTRWGWLPAIAFSIAALIGMMRWKPFRLSLRIILMLFSILVLILSSIWFLGIYFISHLTP